MGQSQGINPGAVGREADILKNRLKPNREPYFKALNLLPENTLFQRMTDEVIKLVFSILPDAGASYDDGDFRKKIRKLESMQIHCRTFYIYYPRSREELFQDAASRIQQEVYNQILSFYLGHAPSSNNEQEDDSRIAAVLRKLWDKFLQVMPGGKASAQQSPAAGPNQSPPIAAPAIEEFKGLKELVNKELRKACLASGLAETEIKSYWDGINNQRVWLRDNVLGCWVRAYPRDDLSSQVYIVGRPNLYYRPYLENLEVERGEPIHLAARLRLKSEGRVNSHDINRRNPGYIHIIDTRERWDFTAGSLEHDHFIINRTEPQTIIIKEVSWRRGDGWPIELEPPGNSDVELDVMGYECPYLDYVKAASETGYEPNIRPRGRVLPRSGGHLRLFLQNGVLVDAITRQGITEDSVASAIEIEPGQCWLIAQSSPGANEFRAWLCFSGGGANWECTELSHRGTYATGIAVYIWRYNRPSSLLPDIYVGELEYPSAAIKPLAITAIKGHVQAIGRREPFSMSDRSMTELGHLKLHSCGRDARTRALYKLELYPKAVSPEVFIIHQNDYEGPLYLRYSPRSDGEQTVTYGGSQFTEVSLDETNLVQYKGEPLQLSGESILLICGTTTLILNTSSSVRLGAMPEMRKAAGTVAEQILEPLGWASRENVEVTLRKIPEWKDVQVEHAGGDVQGTYSQGFVFFGKDNERYFVKCYRSDLESNESDRALAQQEVLVYRKCEDLPVVPPLVAALPSDELPQLLIMPRLNPLDVNGLSLPEILAIGYTLAVLLERLEELNLVHYDVRTTKIGTDDQGRIKLIDYNSVFPVLNEGEPLQLIHRFLVSTGLPEDKFLSPERRQFLSASETERAKILHQIGPPSSVYALAKMLLSIRRGISGQELARQWDEELPGSRHGESVGRLLERMMADTATERPTAREVKEEMKTVLVDLSAKFKNHEDVKRTENLLGSALGQ